MARYKEIDIPTLINSRVDHIEKYEISQTDERHHNSVEEATVCFVYLKDEPEPFCLSIDEENITDKENIMSDIEYIFANKIETHKIESVVSRKAHADDIVRKVFIDGNKIFSGKFVATEHDLFDAAVGCKQLVEIEVAPGNEKDNFNQFKFWVEREMERPMTDIAAIEDNYLDFYREQKKAYDSCMNDLSDFLDHLNPEDIFNVDEDRFESFSHLGRLATFPSEDPVFIVDAYVSEDGTILPDDFVCDHRILANVCLEADKMIEMMDKVSDMIKESIRSELECALKDVDFEKDYEKLDYIKLYNPNRYDDRCTMVTVNRPKSIDEAIDYIADVLTDSYDYSDICIAKWNNKDQMETLWSCHGLYVSPVEGYSISKICYSREGDIIRYEAAGPDNCYSVDSDNDWGLWDDERFMLKDDQPEQSRDDEWEL